MAKDIREIIQQNKEEHTQLSLNHRVRFQQKMQKEIHVLKTIKNNFKWFYVAASITLLLGLAITFYSENTINNQPINIIPKQSITTQQIRLGNISPDLKTIETYYLNSINYELSQLELTEANKELFDGYLLQLEELTNEYKMLTKELNTKGVNDDTINALIENLQLCLQLLKRMQKQLHEFKNPTQNEIKTI